MSLADTIDKAVREGRLERLSVYRTAEGRWQANALFKGSIGWIVEIRDDPSSALAAVLGPRPPQPVNDDNGVFA